MFSAGSKIQELIDEGTLVAFQSYGSRSSTDFSGNGNNSTIENARWANGGITFMYDGRATISDSSILQLVEGALIVYGSFNNHEPNKRFISKRDGGGTNYAWFQNLATDQLGFYDGSITRTLPQTVEGKKSFGLNFKDGEAANGFADGLASGNYNGVSTVTVNDADVLIGNNTSAGNYLSNVLKHVLIFNRRLTATEHAEVFGELSEAYPFPTQPYQHVSANQFIDPGELGLIAGWNMKPVGNQIIDVSAEGNNGDFSGITIHKASKFGHSLYFNGTDSGIDGDAPTISGYPFAIVAIVEPDLGSITGEFFDLVDNGSPSIGYGLSIDINGQPRTRAANGAANVYGTSGVDIRGKTTHLVAVFESATIRKLYINGALDNTSTTSIAWNAGADRFSMGYRGDSSPSDRLEGRIHGFIKVYDDLKDDSWVLEAYQQIIAAQFKFDYGIRQSITPTTSGHIENTGLVAESGSFSVDLGNAGTTPVSTNDKVLTCVSAGLVSLETALFKNTPTEAAYGYFQVPITCSATTEYLTFISNIVGVYGAAGLEGYQLAFLSNGTLILRKNDDGVDTTLFSTATGYLPSVGENFIVGIGRSASGEFSVYINDVLVDVTGGSGSNPVTNNDFTISNFLLWQPGADAQSGLCKLNGEGGFYKRLLT